MFKRNVRGQGALEYLLILGAAIIVVAVVIFMMLGAATTAPTDDATNSIDSSFDQLRDLIPSSGGGGVDLSCTTTTDCTSGSCGEGTCQEWPGTYTPAGGTTTAPDSLSLPTQDVGALIFGSTLNLLFSSDYAPDDVYYYNDGGGQSIDFHRDYWLDPAFDNRWVIGITSGVIITEIVSAEASEEDGPFEADWSSAQIFVSGTFVDIVDLDIFDDGTWSTT
jgi:hypothetical protein